MTTAMREPLRNLASAGIAFGSVAAILGFTHIIGVREALWQTFWVLAAASVMLTTIAYVIMARLQSANQNETVTRILMETFAMTVVAVPVMLVLNVAAR